MTSPTKPKHSWQFDAIGTRWSIDSVVPLSAALQETIAEYIETFDSVYSRFRDDSTVARMAQSAGSFSLQVGGDHLGELYRQLYEATNGAVSPLVGSSLNAAGYDKNYSFVATRPRPAQAWNSVMEWQGSTLNISQPIELDVGAAGKGLLVDDIAKIVEQAGIKEFTVDASGDVLTRGAVQRIGLENPYDTTTVIGVIDIKNESICASAINRRSWGDDWHHVLDARTGLPVGDVVATWVIAEATIVADGLATALFFESADKLRHIAKFDYVRVLKDGTIEYSKRFMGQLFT